ncbi:MAG TPA: glycosyltransferase family 2 protein [Chthonomonadaceae bacterium]|nr:glycosyltransferase family 2 protein [Chthonomonadaceae bacterium]
MKVGVVIVNYNTASLCLKAIETLQKASGIFPFEVTVVIVDNASCENDVQILREMNGNGFRLLESGYNGGFGAGNNIGIRFLLDSENVNYILLLNSDAYFHDPMLLSRMVSAMEADTSLGLLGPHTQYPSGETQITIGTFPRPLWKRLMGRLWSRSTPNIRSPYDSAVDYVEVVSAVCLLLRATTLQQIGLFDEAFFMYFEEVELAMRAHAKRWKTGYLSISGVTHLGKTSSRKANLKVIWHNRVGRCYTLYKHGHRGMALIEMKLLSCLFALAQFRDPWIRSVGSNWFAAEFRRRITFLAS